MPLFAFTCNDCEETVELLVRGTETPECPRCGSKDMARQASAFAAVGAGKENGSPAPQGPVGCGGPGCCMM